MDLKTPITKFADPKYDVILSRDFFNINLGVFLTKKSDFSFQFWKEVNEDWNALKSQFQISFYFIFSSPFSSPKQEQQAVINWVNSNAKSADHIKVISPFFESNQ
jgi:hypothetical protein